MFSFSRCIDRHSSVFGLKAIQDLTSKHIEMKKVFPLPFIFIKAIYLRMCFCTSSIAEIHLFDDDDHQYLSKRVHVQLRHIVTLLVCFVEMILIRPKVYLKILGSILEMMAYSWMLFSCWHCCSTGCLKL